MPSSLLGASSTRVTTSQRPARSGTAPATWVVCCGCELSDRADHGESTTASTSQAKSHRMRRPLAAPPRVRQAASHTVVRGAPTGRGVRHHPAALRRVVSSAIGPRTCHMAPVHVDGLARYRYENFVCHTPRTTDPIDHSTRRVRGAPTRRPRYETLSTELAYR